MKKPLLWMALLLWGTTIQQCTEDGEILKLEKVQFTCSLTTLDPEGRIQFNNAPTTLLLSLEDLAGNPVVTNKKISLLQVGGSFMSAEPLELLSGHYRITGFLLLADSATVLYATPRRGSPLAHLVEHPLPYKISVDKNTVSQIEMEVVDVTQNPPEDLGYASFLIHTINLLKIGVFATRDDQTDLTSAEAYVLRDADTIGNYSLPPALSLISFHGDPQDVYTLIVNKEGYKRYTREFIYSELTDTLDGNPLKVSLIEEPIFTMSMNTDYLEGSFTVTVAGAPGLLTVDWGDGTILSYGLDRDETGLQHRYTTRGAYLIKVTGDVEKITLFNSIIGNGPVTSMNLRGLTDLEEIRYAFTSGPGVLDLTNSKKIRKIVMPQATDLISLLLPTENMITSIEINGPNLITTAEVDKIIDKVYRSAVSRNEMNGTFVARDYFLPSEKLVGPPSASGLAKLRRLRDTYNWTITPNPM